MSRYIDADKLVERTKEFRKRFVIKWDVLKVITWINSEPTVDAVEPVRCKDCIRKTYDDGFAECYFLGVVSPDDYCSHGKRAVK